METLKKIQIQTTYLVIDQITNRFNFCGLVGIGEQAIVYSVNGKEYDLDGDMPDDVKKAIEVIVENSVDITDFKSVVRFVKDDTTYYYLTF